MARRRDPKEDVEKVRKIGNAADMLPGAPVDTMDVYTETLVRTPAFYMPYEHTHSVLECYYLRQGQCIYIVNGAFVQLKAGDLMIVAPGDLHNTSYNSTQPSIRTTVFANTDKLSPVLKTLVSESDFRDLETFFHTSQKYVFREQDRATLELFIRQISEEQTSPGPHSQARLLMTAGSFLTMIRDRGIPSEDIYIPLKNLEPKIQQAIHMIDTGYASFDLTLETIASAVQLSPAYLSHRFKKVTGHSFKEYLNNVRIRNAAQQLLVTDDSITKIALGCGFSSSNYFKDVFRRLHGVSPRAYRSGHGVSEKHGHGLAQ
ncbi:MAG: helix-turn-helix domain-containing protein [Lachnospiraceae bacterium]|nr:helix-turn-helix domain-containing protein [Lachnospiraceae bacterium]